MEETRGSKLFQASSITHTGSTEQDGVGFRHGKKYEQAMQMQTRAMILHLEDGFVPHSIPCQRHHDPDRTTRTENNFIVHKLRVDKHNIYMRAALSSSLWGLMVIYLTRFLASAFPCTHAKRPASAGDKRHSLRMSIPNATFRVDTCVSCCSSSSSLYSPFGHPV